MKINTRTRIERTRRWRLVTVISAASVSTMVATTAAAAPDDDDDDATVVVVHDDDDDYDTVEYPDRPIESGVQIYIAPGVINVPYGGMDSLDYRRTFDPGYQWGAGLGYFMRGSERFGMAAGAFFDHAIINREGFDLGDDNFESMYRVGIELRPGLILGERVFLNMPLRAGFVADMQTTQAQDRTAYGGMVGIGGGIDVALINGLYAGTDLATDLQFFRAGDATRMGGQAARSGDGDYDSYMFAWRMHVGYRF